VPERAGNWNKHWYYRNRKQKKEKKKGNQTKRRRERRDCEGHKKRLTEWTILGHDFKKGIEGVDGAGRDPTKTSGSRVVWVDVFRAKGKSKNAGKAPSVK